MKTTTTIVASLMFVAFGLAGCLDDGSGQVSGAVSITDAPSEAKASEPFDVEWRVGGEDDQGSFGGNVSAGNGSASGNVSGGNDTEEYDFGTYTTSIYWGYASVSEPNKDAYNNSTTEQTGQSSQSFRATITPTDPGTLYLRGYAELEGKSVWSEEVMVEVTNGTNASGDNTVEITEAPVGLLSEYNPAALTIKVGESVVWENQDGDQHTATADDGSFDTGDIAPNETSDPIVFDTAGEYAYTCQYHQTMTGTIVVEE